MVKYRFLTTILIICFVLFNVGNKPTGAEEELDLLALAEVFHNENIFIQEWSLYSREKLDNQTNIEAYVNQLRRSFPNAKWSTESDENKTKIKAILKTSQKINESILILSAHTTNTTESYIIYEVNGSGWEKESEQFLLQEFQRKADAIFREDTTIFSCIKGEINDKINVALPYYAKHLLDVFDANEIEALKENSFVSTSAYSRKFAENIETKGKTMNLQLGIRKQGLGAKTTIVAGTPIITIEY
ncbi:YwmB family TATA-box binding protein [Bacillus sp. 03113]|uniref:YwmB family TATA-box binding protein n=1 Tax=Bacillus sp. 03113 TaxID=2578211 RepID=UPI001143AF82|nr:YwmB family TATA-box binding protein [Bacillus sp. 03113]